MTVAPIGRRRVHSLKHSPSSSCADTIWVRAAGSAKNADQFGSIWSSVTSDPSIRFYIDRGRGSDRADQAATVFLQFLFGCAKVRSVVPSMPFVVVVKNSLCENANEFIIKIDMKRYWNVIGDRSLSTI